MQSCKNEHTHSGTSQPQTDSFVVAHFSDEYDIRVGTHCSAQSQRERLTVDTYFPVDDGAVFIGMHEFDRVFDGDDVLAVIVVDVVQHSGKSGRFT